MVCMEAEIKVIQRRNAVFSGYLGWVMRLLTGDGPEGVTAYLLASQGRVEEFLMLSLSIVKHRLWPV